MSAGWRSPGLRSETLPMAPSGLIICHRPVSSGLPSGVRGAGAVRFGLPSAVRGMPAVGWFTHCAATGALSADRTIMTATVFMMPPHSVPSVRVAEGAYSVVEDGGTEVTVLTQ